MPTLVHFGAGNIGRGFIAPTFTGGGWEVVFVDVADEVVERMNTQGRYRVLEVDTDGEAVVEVSPVRAVNGKDLDAVAAAVAAADLVGTSVGLGALRFLGPGLAAGFAKRSGPLDILVCENGTEAPALLKEAIAAHLPDSHQPRLETELGLIRTSIGRMVPPAAGDLPPLDIRVEPYKKLPVEAEAFKGTPPVVPNLKLAPNFDLILEQKLYLHNCTHAATAYAGILKGYDDIPDAIEDPEILVHVRLVADEVVEGLARRHASPAQNLETIRAENREMAEDLFIRYRNRALADPLRRVARDPIRKLGPTDRLVGSARMCAENGIQPLALAHAILNACAYPIADDEPGVERFKALQQQGWLALLSDISQLDPKEPLMSTSTLAARQQQAADLIREAGIFLKDEEVAQIEIADFGLNRYEEVGLAIHVYCNTNRCCAKELAMLPGMMCPEHIHPEVDGQPGKEETFRVRQGECFMFLPGKGNQEEAMKYCQTGPETVTVFQKYHLKQGDQVTLPPDTKHWFVAGPEGCVVSEFSTKSRDDADIFTDLDIQRVPDEGPHNG